jgi:hypothetical protein
MKMVNVDLAVMVAMEQARKTRRKANGLLWLLFGLVLGGGITFVWGM